MRLSLNLTGFGLLLSALFLPEALALPASEPLGVLAKQVPHGKGEFESSTEYRERVRRAQRSHVFVGIPEEIAYDADAEVFRIKPQMQRQGGCESHGTYIGRTAMNLKFTVTRKDCEFYAVAVKNEEILGNVDIHVPRKEAPRWKNDLGVVYHAAVSENENGDPASFTVSVYRTSLDEPYDGIVKKYELSLVVDRLDVIRLSSRKVVFTVTRAAQEEAERREEEERSRIGQQEAEEQRREEEARQAAFSKYMPLFRPSSYPRYQWPQDEESHYVANCIKELAGRYHTRRTADQIRYACECITWNLENTYSRTEIADLLSDKPRLETVMTNTGSDCKRHRPAELGPDPSP